MTGEESHEKGRDGARRAKLWLESTTRVNAQWVNPDPIAVPKLSFKWADGRPYSFDLGGILLGEDLHGQEFLAECKNYPKPRDQGTAYRRYLASCYRALVTKRDRCDNFMWITWAPFLVNIWDELTSAGMVERAVVEHSPAVFGANLNPEEVHQEVSHDTCKDVADRLWIICLSDRQEKLTLTRKHLGVIRDYDTNNGVY